MIIRSQNVVHLPACYGKHEFGDFVSLESNVFVISVSNLNVSGIQKRRPIILLSHYQGNTNSVHGVYACNPLTVLVGEFACDVDVHRFGNSFACPSDNRITIVHRAMLHKGIEMAGAISLSLSLVTKYLTCGSDERLIFVPPSLIPPFSPSPLSPSIDN